MTEEHKLISLAGFQTLRDKALSNMADWQKTARTVVRDGSQSVTPIPYGDAVVDISQVIDSLQAMVDKFQEVMDYIRDTPAEQLTMDSVIAKSNE